MHCHTTRSRQPTSTSNIGSEGLPEPRRIKPLPTCFGTMALSERHPSVNGEDQHAVLAAREIQSQLLKDSSTKPSLLDWFVRMEGPAMSTDVLQPDLQR